MKLISIAAFLPLALTMGCASNANKKVESDIAKQSEVTSSQATDSGRRAIEDSDQLTEPQKQKMLALMDSSKAELASIRESEAQTKASLYKYLADGKFETAEISTYRAKLRNLGNKRMDLMFTNLKQAQKILGKEAKLNSNMMDFERFNGEKF